MLDDLKLGIRQRQPTKSRPRVNEAGSTPACRLNQTTRARPQAGGCVRRSAPADFKGQFKTGNGCYCYPLTITDHFSRALLVCRGLPSVHTEFANPAFRALFRDVGLPDAIPTDNGAPFASTGIHELSALNVWWMQLGIVHQRILPALRRLPPALQH